MPGVVVGISRPRKAVIRHFVPFFARDLARFATNAYSRIGEEADFDVFLHVIVPPLVRAVCAFADHNLLVGRDRRARRASRVNVSDGPAVRPTSGALILCLPWRDRLRLYLRLAAVPRDVERPGLLTAHICSGNRRMRVHAADALAQCCRCRLWLP